MILQPMSDLHSDFPGFKGYPAPAPGASVIVVAGDTRQGLAAALRELRAAYPPSLEVVVVAGNHEFWARPALPAAIDEGRRVAADLGLHYLENEVTIIGGPTGVRFAGCLHERARPPPASTPIPRRRHRRTDINREQSC
ncbi:NADPH-dependent 2,4-dienoyl-CoA reductase/sulfur reductase-like enzyme [Bradyrhizobium sp. GM7.3]